MIKYKSFIILSIFIFLNHCDIEKFTGYDHTAPPLPISAQIYGKVTNLFTGEPVDMATIRIGEQATFSDEHGEFEFYYFLAEDDERNKASRLIISEKHYTTIDTTIVIFPENKVDKKLEYACPIIKRTALIGGICQAEVFDYQGFQDISSVYGSFFYRLPGDKMWALNTSQALTRVAVDSPNTAYFQTSLPEEIPGFGLLQTSFKIFARDRGVHSDSTTHSETGIDSLFIPVVH